MTSFRGGNLRSLLILYITLFSFIALADDTFHVYLRNFALGQGIDVNLGTYTLDDLGKPGLGMSELAQKALREGPSQMQVVLYVPQGISEAEKNEYGNLILEKLKTSYPQTTLKAEFSFLDPVTAKQEMEKDNKEIENEFERSPAANEETQKISGVMKFFNKLKYLFNAVTRVSDIKDAILKLKSKNPLTQYISIATTVGLSKGIVNATAWVATSKDPGIAAYMSAVTSWALDIWFAKNANLWVDWKRQSKLTWNRFGFGALAKWINKSEARRTWFVDQLNGLFWSHYFRTLAYMDNPEKVNPIYSVGAIKDFWFPYLLSSLIGGPIAAKSQIAINNLRQKGLLNPQAQYYTFLAYDTNFTLTNFMLQKGISTAYWSFVIAEWGTRLGYVVANQYLPPKYKKLVVIDPRIPLRDHSGILHKEGFSSAQSFEEGISDWDLRVRGVVPNTIKCEAVFN